MRERGREREQDRDTERDREREAEAEWDYRFFAHPTQAVWKSLENHEALWYGERKHIYYWGGG